ncbi:MAG: amine oxidase [Rickettsiales bacterium]|nr:amine oxidase [Rickettsiales bacterium]
MKDVIVIGSGMGALSAAAMLCTKGLKPLIIEQNWQPGGCTSSYWRKGYVFESGATTLVGLDEHMPLRFLLDQTGIELKTRKLELPMQIHLAGKVINRYQDLTKWKAEAARHFVGNQDEFWDQAYAISQFVWKSSTKYLHFPPNKLVDWINLIKKANPLDVVKAKYSLKSTTSILNKHQLNDPGFRKFVNEQLLITAQNHADEVNHLFGAAALCYTNYGNYYIDGGLLNLVNPIIDFIQSKGGEIIFREEVKSISKSKAGYQIQTKTNQYKAPYLISGIPLNNLLSMDQDCILPGKTDKELKSEQLYSAFQMGIAFRSHREFESLHHQIHLETPLIESGSNSIFLSLSHPKDETRAKDGATVASISTHIKDPLNTQVDSSKIEKAIVNTLIRHDFLKEEQILFSHSSGPKSWNKWTGRAFGFVGGYPQYLSIKPWQMVEARFDNDKAYQCGDTSYPGQGIPGATLSGIIAAQKLASDWL